MHVHPHLHSGIVRNDAVCKPYTNIAQHLHAKRASSMRVRNALGSISCPPPPGTRTVESDKSRWSREMGSFSARCCRIHTHAQARKVARTRGEPASRAHVEDCIREPKVSF
jgi:hypothetical protein